MLRRAKADRHQALFIPEESVSGSQEAVLNVFRDEDLSAYQAIALVVLALALLAVIMTKTRHRPRQFAAG